MFLFGVFTVVLSSLLVGAPAAWADESDKEFEFASGLIGLGFPDYADKVVQQVLKLHPDQKDRAKLIQAEILISRRKFAEAEELVKSMGAENPKAQAISLALAKGYYTMGDMDKAKALYNAFFKQYEGGKMPTDPDLLRFYQDSAYQFGQMLEMAGDSEGAIKAYARVLPTNPDRDIARRIQSQQAELYVKWAQGVPADQREAKLAEAKKLCETLQWGGLDIWFGQSIITLAHIEIVRDNKTAAQKVLTSNMDILKEIDKFLKEQNLPLSVSPMAGARFLLGDLYEQQAAEQAKSQSAKDQAVQSYAHALTEYYNVFAQYGDSEWGSEAGLRAQRVKGILEDTYGKKVNVDLGVFQNKAAETQFKMADNLYRQKQYKEAAEEYLKNLNAFPETDASPMALASLTLCYANLDDKLMVKMLCGYLSERFSKKDSAAMAMLVIGKYYFDKKDEPMYMNVYETYLRQFPKHERAAGILFTMASLRRQTNDVAGAIKYYERILKDYKTDQYYPKALNQLAWGYYLGSNYAAAASNFAAYAAVAQPSPDKAQAQFALADSLRALGKMPEALAEYEKLVQWLAPKQNPYSTSAADAQKNNELLEKAVFQRGYCYARMNEPKEMVADYRARGIKAYDQFIQLYPQSKLAPKAMNGKGTIQLELNQFDVAAKTFEDLTAKYPQSEEGKNALFLLVRSAMEIKKYDQAKIAFNKMMTEGGNFGPSEYARIGQMMLDAGMNAEAIQAFAKVTASDTQDRNLLERSLYGMGKAQYEMKNYNESIKALEDLMIRYPKSGLFYDAKFTLGGAYRAAGRLDEAQKSLSDVFKYADKPQLINKASYDLGMIQKEQKLYDAALASFLRVALLADPNDAELRPLIEKSLLESIDLGMQLKRYQDVLDSCDQYFKLFPSGAQIEAVRKSRADAKLKATAGGAAVAPAAPAAPAAK